MTEAELTAVLVKVKAAINYILTGNAQSLGIAGRNLVMLDLKTLNDLRKEYEAELANVDGARPSVIQFQRPS